MKRVIVFCLMILLFISCRSYSEKDLIGVYTPVNYRNTFDTIHLKKNNKYYRTVYNKSKERVIEIRGEWSVREDVIEFKSLYFLNLDRDLVMYPELLQDTESNGLGYIWKKVGVFEFCVGYFGVDLPNQNCYRRLND